MQNQNNLLLGLFLALLAFLCAIPLEWFTITNATGPFGGMFPGTISVTGINGHITLLFSVPIWLLLMLSALATGIAISNRVGFTTIPSPLLGLALVLTGAHYVAPYFFGYGRLSISAGPVIAQLATVTALILTFARSPRRTSSRHASL